MNQYQTHFMKCKLKPKKNRMNELKQNETEQNPENNSKNNSKKTTKYYCVFLWFSLLMLFLIR